MTNGDGHDLETLLRGNFSPSAQRRARRIALLGIPLVLLLIAFATGVYTVEPDGKAVVKRFGRVIRIVDPGLHFKLPFGIDTATFVPTERVLKEEFGFRTAIPGQRTAYQKDEKLQEESLMLTGDLNVIEVEWVVQYRIRDPDEYLHRAREQTQTIRDVSEAVMRRIVGNRLGSDVLTVERVTVANEARDSMQEILDDYGMGIHVATVELQDVTPPDKVKPAFNEVNEARQERERAINEAEKHRNQVIPKAEGEAQRTIAEARGYATARVNQAKGEAERFSAIQSEYAQAKDVTRRRLYLETVESVLPEVGKAYVSEGGRDPIPLLRLEQRAEKTGRETP